LTMGSTPVGFLYTPQQLAGSVRYGSGVLLGNWREDHALGDMRMMDHIEAKETGSLTLLMKKQKLGQQLAPVPLTPAPEDGVMKIGDVILMQSYFSGGTLAVSMGQPLRAADVEDPDLMYMLVASPVEPAPCVRNAIKIMSYEGAAGGSPVLYGQKVCLVFSAELGVRGYLSSMRSGRQQLSTQIINKQEVYLQAIRGDAPPYDCAWMILPQNIDDRLISHGTPVVAGAPFVIVHCFTNKCLAAVNVSIPTDFGAELGVCAHTYTAAKKVNKMMRETIGRPTHGLISRSEETENFWGIIYG